jgi:hypothetical protein
VKLDFSYGFRIFDQGCPNLLYITNKKYCTNGRMIKEDAEITESEYTKTVAWDSSSTWGKYSSRNKFLLAMVELRMNNGVQRRTFSKANRNRRHFISFLTLVQFSSMSEQTSRSSSQSL